MIAKTIIKNIIEKNNTILDLGCGKGAWSDFIKDKEFYGVDIDKNNNPLGYKEVLHEDLNFFPLVYENNFFDLIIAKDIVEHLIHPQDMLREAHRVLKPKGTLIVKVPDYRSKNAWADYTHIRPYTKGAIISLIEDQGFTVESVTRLGGYFFPTIIPQGFSWLVIARK